MKKYIQSIPLILGGLICISAMLPNTSINIDNRIPVDQLDNCSSTRYCITEPGHYYLRNSIVETGSFYSVAIRIDSDNVTLDLNGFAIIAGSNNALNGIRVFGSHNTIVIKNGIVRGFGDDGIRAEVADGSTFKNLQLYDNDDDGLNVGDNCIVADCIAINNGYNGIKALDGNIIRDCNTSQNGKDGIEVWDASIVYNCISFKNAENGIEAKYGCRVEGCTVYDNSEYGIEFIDSGICLRNTAYRNGEHGIRGFENLFAMHNVSNDNGICITESSCGSGNQGTNINQGAGIRAFRDAMIVDNECIGNYFGIAVSDAGSTISNNKVQKNKHAGIIAAATGNLIIKNKGEGNGFLQSPSITDIASYPLGNIVFGPGDFENSSVGPIINASTAGDISTLSGADHPFANFIY
ncbi:MAG: right-handed parallel beta-helix repeat-containing protein [Saprospiraceae bacterium]|nr:right-handed parallel beta-helix repeat-containing protein [Saprospiraceae bacterium]